MNSLTAIPMTTALIAISSAAWAHGDEHHAPRIEELRALAHEVDDAASHVVGEASRDTSGLCAQGTAALMDLRRLAEAARHFQRQVEQNSAYDLHAAADFERLVSTFRVAEHSLPVLRVSSHVRSDWQRLDRAMGMLIDLRERAGDRRYERDDERRRRSRVRRVQWYRRAPSFAFQLGF